MSIIHVYIGSIPVRAGQPKNFNTDQGSQFTSEAFSGLLLERGQGQHGWQGQIRGHILVERLWRSVQYEEVYLNA